MVASNPNPNGWTWVFGKKNKQHSKPIDDSIVKDVEKIATSFCVSNFPNYLDAKNLLKEFQPFGRIVDAFIANKRSKQGKRFSFIRFLGVRNEFPRVNVVWPKSNSNNIAEIYTKKSYASVIHGEISARQTCHNDMKNVKRVLLDECDLIKVEDASIVVMVKVKEIDTISNMYHVCRNEGFDDIKIHYIEAEDCMSMGRVWIATKIQSLIYEKVEVNILGKTFQDFVKEIGTWNIHISNDIELNDSDNEDISSNGNVDQNETLDDFIQHVVEEKEVEKTPPKDPKADDSKPLGFEKGPIYNIDDVTSRAGNEDVSFSTDQVKDNHTVTHKDMATDEVVSDNSKPPSFEKFIKENKACSRSSSTSRAGKCSTSFANYSRKYLKGFSFIDEMNRMIELGEALGYDVKGCKNILGD
ncbi:RNA-directed DNA polymerase, eukaryota, reverse transcriptase zinc-binding domain protein [Tanacetum coccineum]